jgi:hypothetical protein
MNVNLRRDRESKQASRENGNGSSSAFVDVELDRLFASNATEESVNTGNPGDGPLRSGRDFQNGSWIMVSGRKVQTDASADAASDKLTIRID